MWGAGVAQDGDMVFTTWFLVKGKIGRGLRRGRKCRFLVSFLIVRASPLWQRPLFAAYVGGVQSDAAEFAPSLLAELSEEGRAVGVAPGQGVAGVTEGRVLRRDRCADDACGFEADEEELLTAIPATFAPTHRSFFALGALPPTTLQAAVAPYTGVPPSMTDCNRCAVRAGGHAVAPTLRRRRVVLRPPAVLTVSVESLIARGGARDAGDATRWHVYRCAWARCSSAERRARRR